MVEQNKIMQQHVVAVNVLDDDFLAAFLSARAFSIR
jgi:hypothetical protein